MYKYIYIYVYIYLCICKHRNKNRNRYINILPVIYNTLISLLVVDCGTPPALRNAKAVLPYPYSTLYKSSPATSASNICLAGYNFQQKDNLRLTTSVAMPSYCLADGTWSSPSWICVGK